MKLKNIKYFVYLIGSIIVMGKVSAEKQIKEKEQNKVSVHSSVFASAKVCQNTNPITPKQSISPIKPISYKACRYTL